MAYKNFMNLLWAKKVFLPCSLNSYVKKYLRPSPAKTSKNCFKKSELRKKNYCKSLSDNLTTLLLKLLLLLLPKLQLTVKNE